MESNILDLCNQIILCKQNVTLNLNKFKLVGDSLNPDTYIVEYCSEVRKLAIWYNNTIDYFAIYIDKIPNDVYDYFDLKEYLINRSIDNYTRIYKNSGTLVISINKALNFVYENEETLSILQGKIWLKGYMKSFH